VGAGPWSYFAYVELLAEVLDLAVAGRPVQDFLDEGEEVVEGPHWRHGCGEAVVEDAARGAEDEGVADDVERDALVVRCCARAWSAGRTCPRTVGVAR
jgi:hypothetical protein